MRASKLAAGASTRSTLRSAALGSVIGALAADGRIPGWRDETYADPQRVRRAAARVHRARGVALLRHDDLRGASERRRRDMRIGGAPDCGSRAAATRRRPIPACSTMSWRAESAGVSASRRRSSKECWEEAGISRKSPCAPWRGAPLMCCNRCRKAHRPEQIFIYDLALPADFAPRNQDGEVGEHRLARIDEVARWIEEGAMTVDAESRHARLPAASPLDRRRGMPGIEALFTPPIMG